MIFRRTLPPMIILVLVIASVEAAVRLHWVASFILPAPSTLLQTLLEDRREFFSAFASTAGATIVGLGASWIVGVLAAMAFSSFRLLRRAIYPYAIFFQTVPIIAIAPLLVIWFGFGQPTVMVSAFIVSIFPVVASTLQGLDSTDPALEDLFRIYDANMWQRLVKLKVPSALPHVFSGLRVAAGLAVIGSIVGEFIAGGGLGEIVDVARTQQRVDKVFVAVLLSTVLGLVMIGAINFLSWLLSWRREGDI